jgi:site-specific recombinase XerD
MLTPYRRHTETCPHRAKGQHYTLCQCPTWCYGQLPNGEPVRQSLKTMDWSRAQQRLEHVLRGGDVFESRSAAPDLASAITQFLASCKARNLEDSTVASYTRTLEHLKAALGESRNISSVSVEALDAAHGARPVAPRTRRKELEHLRAFFAFCFDRNWIAKNPAKRLRAPLVEDVATLPFEPYEVDALIAACDKIASDNPKETGYVRHRARALVYALLYSGLRISDVAQLRRAALSAKTRHLTLRMMKTKQPLKVLLHEDAAKALQTLPLVSTEYFFWTGRGDLITCVKNLRRTVQRLGLIADVRAHPHLCLPKTHLPHT